MHGTKWTCESCRRRVTGTRHSTILGREICGTCNDELGSRTIGLLIAGGDPVQAVPDTVAVRGVRGWMRRSLGKGATDR